MTPNTANTRWTFRDIVASGLGLGCVLIVICLLVARVQFLRSHHSPSSEQIIADLVAASEKGLPCDITINGTAPHLRTADLSLAREYLFANSNASAYHVLLKIRELNLSEYARIPAIIKLRVLMSYLSNTRNMTDWGPIESPFPGDVGSALLAVGHDALPWLFQLLDDDTELGGFDGQEQVASEECHYRRKDIAFKYIMLILNRTPYFDRDFKRRDEHIARLHGQKNGILREWGKEE